MNIEGIRAKVFRISAKLEGEGSDARDACITPASNFAIVRRSTTKLRLVPDLCRALSSAQLLMFYRVDVTHATWGCVRRATSRRLRASSNLRSRSSAITLARPASLSAGVIYPMALLSRELL